MDNIETKQFVVDREDYYKEIGLTVIENFITEEEEKEILSNVGVVSKKLPNRGRSSIKRFGSSEPYKNFMVSSQVPDYILKIAKKIVAKELLDKIPDHATLNEYLPGGNIPKHIDSKESGEIITIISLLSDCEMIFQKDGEGFAINFPRRALVQLKNEIRWEWTHQIDEIKNLRYSIVFRDSKG